MAALPKFSFSGWSSSRISPQVNPAAVQETFGGLAPPGGTVIAPATAGTSLVGTTNAANTNLPAWLQAEVDRLNAQEALRKAALGGGGSAPAPTQNVGDLLQGAAAQQTSAALYNQQVFGMNEAARLQNLIRQRNQIQPVGGFGFNNPMDVNRQIGLDREIDAYRSVNLPISAGGNFRPSGWVNPFRTF